jgi:putative membrane protein
MLQKLSALPAAIFVLLIAPLQAIAQTQQPSPPPPDYYWRGPWHMWGYGYGGGPFWGMFPVMILFMVLLCVVIFYFARVTCAGGRQHWGPSSQTRDDPTHSALQILNERFARGEIQKQEYEEKKSAILSGGRR